MSLGILKLFLILFQLRQCAAVIYNLNASEYNKMPPVFKMDPFDSCQEKPGAVYCVVDFVPVSDTPHHLLDTMREYSEHTPTHFNHTLMRYGVCLNFCKQYNQNHNTTADREYTLEACLNESFWDRYRLNISLQYHRCNEIEKKIEFETVDIIMLVVLIAILLLNVVGSYCDFKFPTNVKGFVSVLMFFSIRRNWRKLVKPAAVGPDPRLTKLKALNGLKSITMILVVLAHTLISAYFYIDNPKRVEDYYKDFGIQLFLNGTILVQTFFIISGFLLIYNQLLYSEKHKFGWTMLPKGMVMRWIRLTPSYAVVMLFTVSWMRFVSNGATWEIRERAVMGEVEDCRQNWWQHLIYINNYKDHSQCFSQSWYLAADMQLFCLGLIVAIACKSTTSKKVIISALLLAGLIIPPLHTYFQDLDGIVITSPETSNHFFVNDPTYNNLYKRGHTNLFNYAIGLAVGYIVYHLQQVNFNIHKYKKYKVFLWCYGIAQFPLMMSGSIFYQDGPKPQMVVRLAYATLVKPVYGVFLAFTLVALVFKYEKICRFVLEWRLWTVLGRLSYSTYLLHVTILRIVLGQRENIVHVSVNFMAQQVYYIAFLSVFAAVPFWCLVEQPFGQLMKFVIKPEMADHKLSAQNGAKEKEVDELTQNKLALEIQITNM